MRLSILPMALLFGATAIHAGDDPQMDAAKRFVSAVEGEADFLDSDFVSMPSLQEQQALKELYSDCGKRHPIRPLSKPDGNQITILYNCPGIPRNTPMGISLTFDGNEIAQVTLHNADLREQSDG